MSAIVFEFANTGSSRSMAVEGDTLAQILGRVVGVTSAGLTFNVTDQPAGSDIFAGLGTAGSDLPYTDLASATFTQAGFHVFTVSHSGGDASKLAVICFDALAPTVSQIKYVSAKDTTVRPTNEIRNTLRALAMQATQTGAEAMEAGTSAPFHGTSPVTLCGHSGNNYKPFGGW